MQQHSTLVLHKQVLPFLNISLYLNDIKPIQSLIIENSSNLDSGHLTLCITADLPCIEPFNYNVYYVPAHKEVKISLEALKVNREYISKLSESEKSIFTIEIFENEVSRHRESHSITIHPLEYFGGFEILPELIASYSTPNHSYVYHIKRKAIEVLAKQGLTPAFEGYQSYDPERVLQIMSAIYTAIQSEEIVYSSLPPGYEETGQRLRLLNTIQQEKFGNCIDLSLLFAACLEAVNINPILIIVRGHAFVGCWLHDEKFPEVINDDKTAITKRIAKGIREIAVVESTSLCKGYNINFSDALNAGEAQLVQKEDFLLSIDIMRARTLRIRPLPLIMNSTGAQLDDNVIMQFEVHAMERNFELGKIYQDELLQDKRPKTKQKIWERKLLDLSLRNSLLNLHMTRNMLQMVDIDISHLEDTLSDGKSFLIMPNPNAEVIKKYNLFTSTIHHSSPLYELANDELKQNRLLTHYHQQDLDNILVYIHKNAKQAIEENGSSTLYLAVGLLKWFDRKTPTQSRYAPILLLPVEISRRSVNSKFTLKSREEETMVNITLVEFLRQEYELNLSALEQLPMDNKGVDVAKVMGILRRAIMQLKGWDVEEQLVLGNFSFSKLILWKDIVDHHDDLLKSNMVRSLVEGKLVQNGIQEASSFCEIDNLDSQSVLLPIPTDVSQMEAVIAAQKGESFILHGPPGTGKSQTITNIIADSLYRGKRVLFVAAKKAALDVVHRRLEQIGLAPFTLELHSNKSKKSDVLEQLAKSIETIKPSRMLDFKQEAQRLDTAKKAIRGYVNILHKKQESGWNLYDSITALEYYQDKKFSKNLIAETVLQQLNPSLWQQWNDWLPQFQSIIKIIAQPSENPLTAFNLSQYSPAINEEIALQTQKLLNILPDIQAKSENLEMSLHFPFSIQSKTRWDQFVQIINELKNLPNIPLELMLYLSYKEDFHLYEEWSRLYKEYSQLKTTLENLSDIPSEFIQYVSDKENFKKYEEWSNIFTDYQSVISNILIDYSRSILTEDITITEIQWRKAQQKWFLSKWLQTNNIKKQLSVFRKNSFSNISEVEQLFLFNNQLRDIQTTLQKTGFVEIQNKLGFLYKGEQTDVEHIHRKAKLIYDLNSQLNELRLLLQDDKFANVQYALKNLLNGDQTDFLEIEKKVAVIVCIFNKTNLWEDNLLRRWVQILVDKNFKFSDEIKQNNLTAIEDFLQLTNTFQEQKKNYEIITGINFNQSENWNSETISYLKNIQKHLPNLKNWLIYLQLRKQGEALRLNWVIDGYENKLCDVDDLTDYFHFTVHTSLAQRVISQYEELSLFNAQIFESKIEQYKKIAKDFQTLTIHELRLNLASKLPNSRTEAMQSSEMGILQRSIKNRGRNLSIRKLFESIPTLLPRIAPCMLMSPISVAQYFDVSTNHFDILIFDEASQLPTCEAISALARTKQAVIVGDPKQMPPTSFFNTTKLDEENMDVEDLESILDDFLSLSIPSKYLLRHYRSKHESLIAFSNVNYYENKLLTFPSSDDINRKVKYHPIEGFYDKGKTRTNRFEADAIVRFIKSHYSDAIRQKLSIGVVTFNQNQQNLIEEKLQKLFMADPKLEEYVNESEEPLFIKNLENVQGDERDIILFSVCYAPDEEGKMSMNFGPLNRNGGWRRLNVAVTRARYEMHIFATLQADQIDMRRTSAEGVEGLKAFLQFADKGHLIVRPEDVQEAFNKQHLSASIGKKIKEEGWEVKCNIGTSGFKVDIGIIHPDKPQQYILGIVIDGHYYYDAKTTNDREMVMPSVLKALGWNIYRIWTMDWFENSEKIIEAILEKVKQLQTQPEVDEIIHSEPIIEPDNTLEEDEIEKAPSNIIRKQKQYFAIHLTSVFNANSETILEFQNRNKIKQQIQSLINTEFPISKSLLYKKLLQAWNISRAGARLDNHLEGIIKEMNVVQTEHHQPFYWSNSTILDWYRSNHIEKRNMEDIAPEEVMVALEEVVNDNLSIEEEELLRYLARTFGFAKVGKQIDILLRYTIDFAIAQEKVKRENGRIKVKS